MQSGCLPTMHKIFMMAAFQSLMLRHNSPVCSLRRHKLRMDFFSEIKGVLSRRQALNRVLTFRHSCFVMLPLHDTLLWIGTSCVSCFWHSTHGIDHSSSSDATTSFLRWYLLADSSSALRKRVRAQLLALIASYILRHDSLRGFGHACRRRVAAMKRSVETTMGCPTLRCFSLS